jgi:hypothetical protein
MGGSPFRWAPCGLFVYCIFYTVNERSMTGQLPPGCASKHSDVPPNCLQSSDAWLTQSVRVQPGAVKSFFTGRHSL